MVAVFFFCWFLNVSDGHGKLFSRISFRCVC